MNRNLSALLPLSCLAALALVTGCQTASHHHAFPAAGADGQLQRRTISVQGKAECNTAPDEFIVQVGVDTFDKDIGAAKRENDDRMKRLLETATKTFKVEAKDVQTTDFRIAPRLEGPHYARVLTGYEVSKRLVIRLRDAKQLETLLQATFENGANRLYGVDFQSSKSIEKRQEARLLAIKAAKTKADALAAALGQKVGPPITIDESVSLGVSNNNFAYDNDTSAGVTETLATGKIKISATVSVVFELVGE